MTEHDVRDAICRTGERLTARGLAPGSSGNISVRLEDGWVTTPTNAMLGALEPARLSRLNASGAHIGGDRPTKETRLHLAMYARRERAQAIVHLHSTYAAAYSCLAHDDPSDVLPPLTAYAIMRVGTLPLLGYAPPGGERLAAELAALDGAHRAALLANHGPIVAETSLDAAAFAAEEIEEVAKIWFVTAGHSRRPLSAEQVAEIRAREAR